MTKQLIVGFCTEGTTDSRFLESIIQRTFEDVAFDCTGQIDILPVQLLDKQVDPFVELVESYARKAVELGVMVLCIHTDADANTDENCFTNKIKPAFDNVLPVKMTESWMLAEKELLKKEIGTSKTDAELYINRNPENIANPKQVIETAIRIAVSGLTRRRRNRLKIGQLYLPIGQKITLSSLENLNSYNKFKTSVKQAFIDLGYLQL